MLQYPKCHTSPAHEYLIHSPAIWSRQFCEESACGIVRAAWCVSSTGSSTRSQTRGLWGRQHDRLPPLFSRIHHVCTTAGAGVHRGLSNPWLFLPWCRRPLRLCSTGSFPGSKICWCSWGSYHQPWLWQLQTGLWRTSEASSPSF